jgi:hypothetical protein
MYAKLVVGNTAINGYRAMRDIGRLITSDNPSVSLLEAYSQSSSVIIDNTPAGWTYVGSNFAGDRPTIAAAGSAVNTTNGVFPNLAFSAPCLDGSTKYALLTSTHYVAAAVTYGTLTGAVSVNSSGVATNEGARVYNGSADGQAEELKVALQLGEAAKTIHLIASPRHITLIEEGRGVQAVWEMSSTDVNTFYGQAPFVQYSHADTSVYTSDGYIVPTLITTTRTASILHTSFGLTNPNTGVYYGTADPTISLTTNIGYFARIIATGIQNGIDSTGLPKYNILPVILSNDRYGYPTQYITGIVPVYFCGASIGSTGDTVDVNGDTHYYFNSGAGYGLLMKLN